MERRFRRGAMIPRCEGKNQLQHDAAQVFKSHDTCLLQRWSSFPFVFLFFSSFSVMASFESTDEALDIICPDSESDAEPGDDWHPFVEEERRGR